MHHMCLCYVHMGENVMPRFGFNTTNCLAGAATLCLLLYSGKSVSEEAEDGESFSTSRMEMDDEGNLIVSRPKISGKIKLTYNADKATEHQMEVDADAYMTELRGQVGAVVLETLWMWMLMLMSVFCSIPVVKYPVFHFCARRAPCTL